MVTAPASSEKPRPVLEHRVGGAVWNRPNPHEEGTSSVAVTIQLDGRVRPHLTVSGKDDNAGIDITQVRAEGLAACINTLLTGELADADEVTTLELLLAAAYNKGLQHQRELAGVS